MGCSNFLFIADSDRNKTERTIRHYDVWNFRFSCWTSWKKHTCSPSSSKRALDFALVVARSAWLFACSICRSQRIPNLRFATVGRMNFDVLNRILFATLVQFNGRPYAPVAAFLLLALFLWVISGWLQILAEQSGRHSNCLFLCLLRFQVAAYILHSQNLKHQKLLHSPGTWLGRSHRIRCVGNAVDVDISTGRVRKNGCLWGLFTLGVLVIFSASTKIVPEQRADPRLKDIALGP